MSPAITFPTIETDRVAFEGGMDQITPILDLKPGVPRDALNVEVKVTKGKQRIGGYERFDGRTKPSSAVYSVIQLERFLTVPVVGQTLTGDTSGTTGTVIAVVEQEETPHLILTLIVGPGFSTTEDVRVGATPIGTATDVTVEITSLNNAIYLNAAADIYRALIAAPAGTGSVRGVFSMNLAGVHTAFQFRDNAGVTASVLYKSTTSGWTIVPYLHEISFTAGGTGVPLDGQTLTQGANTATIKRVMLESGSWQAGTAAGRFIVTAPAPGNFTAGAATAGAVAVTLSGAQTAITMLPGGRFELESYVFPGSAAPRIYGCDKVNRMFEFDGETLAPIKSALPVDAPTHLMPHQNHLMYSYGASAFCSGVGTPFTHTGLSGAAEFPTGSTVLGFKVQPGAQSAPALLIGSQDTLNILYGAAAAGSNPFQLVNFNTSQVGVVEYTMQNLDRSYFASLQGVLDLARVQEFGNFSPTALTYSLQPFYDDKRSLIVASTIHRGKGQYRLFCSDGSGLYSTIANGTFLGAMPVRFPHPVTCVWNGTVANGNEVIYFGSTNGMVYEMERGSSFDGEPIDFYMTLNWDSKRNPRVLKDYRQASLEMQGSFYAAVTFEYVLGYGSQEFERQAGIDYESSFQGATKWDSGIRWDAFIWDGLTEAPTECEMSGSAENFQVRLSGSSDYMYSFSMNSLLTHYIQRRVIR